MMEKRIARKVAAAIRSLLHDMQVFFFKRKRDMEGSTSIGAREGRYGKILGACLPTTRENKEMICLRVPEDENGEGLGNFSKELYGE